jgi:hypothetical protein
MASRRASPGCEPCIAIRSGPAEPLVLDRSLSRPIEEWGSADPGQTIAPRCDFVTGVRLVFFWQNSCRLSSVVEPMSAREKPIYRFGEFELDPGERRLLGHNKSITLTPKVFDTLVRNSWIHEFGSDQLVISVVPGYP